METFVNLGLRSLEKRFGEIDIILNEAQKHYDKSEDIYNALCRSAQVLLLAHFEGYLKDLVKDALDDINYFSNFKNSRIALKRTFCLNFIKPGENGKLNENSITKLIETFEVLDTKFSTAPFFYKDNQNPKISVLDRIAEKFGVKHFYDKISNSKLEQVFSNTDADNLKLRDEIKGHIYDNTVNYPYTLDEKFFEFKETTEKISEESLWYAFLNDVLKRRHDIAHGKEVNNSVHYTDIVKDKIKIEMLIYVFVYCICQNAIPVVE